MPRILKVQSWQDTAPRNLLDGTCYQCRMGKGYHLETCSSFTRQGDEPAPALFYRPQPGTTGIEKHWAEEALVVPEALEFADQLRLHALGVSW